MAASLPPSARRWKYDVFLSFRGIDTRKGITFEIYDRLHRKGIKTFKDDPDLGIGDAISPSLLRAIEESRFAIIVLSPNYGSSSWCLEELRKICECMKDQSRIFPLFYNVEPTEVRYQKRSFKEAFAIHEKYKGSEEVQQWRNALKMVANFSGWDSKNYKTLDINSSTYTGQHRKSFQNQVLHFWKNDLLLAVHNFLACFNYCFEQRALLSYAIGKGLFHDADTDLYEARERADSVVKYLIDVSLLLASEWKGYVRMHDVIRDTAMNIAKSEDGHGFLVARSDLEHWPCRLLEGCSAISLMDYDLVELPEEWVCPNLQILLLNRNLDLTDIPEIFFQSLNELRVLDLSYTSIGLLPQSFSILTNLQALCLDFCTAVNDMSSLRELIKLEILRMRDFQFHNNELPRAIEHMTNLRLLDVSCEMDGTIFTIPAGVISKLHSLEELYMLNCGFEDWGSQVEGEGEEANIGFDEITRLSLNMLQVCISDAKFIPEKVEVIPSWVYFDIHIGPGKREYDHTEFYRTSRSLELVDTALSSLPNWFVNLVATTTEKLDFHGCKGFSNIVMEYDHGILHQLKYLTVRNHDKLKELFNTTTRAQDGQVFENLEELHLNNLDCLEELCIGELPHGSLIHVKVLDVFRCSNLGNVSKLLQRLPNLEKLYLADILRKEYVFGCEGFEPEQSKLREMCLVSLHGVRSICNGPSQLAMFQSLTSLVIFHCESLLSLFTSDVAQCLFQLEDLFIEQCPLLETVIEASKEIVNSKKKIVLPKVKNLVLKRLPMLSGVGATIDIECPSLEHLYAKECPQFSFPTSASAPFHSRNQVQFNVKQQYDFLLQRWERGTTYKIYRRISK